MKKVRRKVGNKAVSRSKDGIRFPTDKRNKTLVELEKAIRGLQSMKTEVRNKRQMSATAFQNFDQKANQLYNLLASVMKAMNEMRSGTIRNML